MAFSKLAEPYEQEVEDMMFIDYDVPYDKIPPTMYYIDGELIVFEGEIQVESIFNYLIKIMKREYESYYEEEYTRVMEHIMTAVGNKERVLRLIYEDMDYPTLRDATCPYSCEGCRMKYECKYCSGMVSHCNAIASINNGENVYFCDENCLSAYFRELHTPKLKENIEELTFDCQKDLSKLLLFDNLLKQKGDIIRFNGITIQGKSSMLRTELEQLKLRLKSQYMKNQYALQLYKSILKRDKPTFLHYFTKLQESYDEQMQLSPTSEDIMAIASTSKHNVENIHKLARIFLGIPEPE